MSCVIDRIDGAVLIDNSNTLSRTVQGELGDVKTAGQIVFGRE